MLTGARFRSRSRVSLTFSTIQEREQKSQTKKKWKIIDNIRIDFNAKILTKIVMKQNQKQKLHILCIIYDFFKQLTVKRNYWIILLLNRAERFYPIDLYRRNKNWNSFHKDGAFQSFAWKWLMRSRLRCKYEFIQVSLLVVTFVVVPFGLRTWNGKIPC